jgi:hypothetical protein
MATYEQIRDAIAARLNTVTDIGNVSNYRRVATTYAQLEAAFTATIGGVKQIRGHSVNLESSGWEPSAWGSSSSMRIACDDVYVVRSYMSANDAQSSDRTFSLLIEAMMTALVASADALTPHLSRLSLSLRQNSYALFDVPGVGSQAVIHYGELAVIVPNQRVI